MMAPDDDDIEMTDEEFDRAMLTAEPVKLVDVPARQLNRRLN